MKDPYLLSDMELARQIGMRIRECRLDQNISQQKLAKAAEVSLSSVIRIEDGQIKSFDTFIRILRTLGLLEIVSTLLNRDSISPSEYYKLVKSAKQAKRKRAAKKLITENNKKESEW